MLMWMNCTFPLVWLLRLVFSVDAMTMGFKGTHKDNLHITYRNEGNSFQVGEHVQEGYTYQLYIRNDQEHPKYLKQGLSLFHLQVNNMFYSVKDEHHKCEMDNLYNSTYYCRSR